MTTPSRDSGGGEYSPEHRPDEGSTADSEQADGQRFVLHKPGGEPVRTGRNLPVAIASGIVLGALVFFSVFPWPQLFIIITSIAVLVGLREVNRAFGRKDVHLAVVPLAVGGVAMQSAAYFGGPAVLL